MGFGGTKSKWHRASDIRTQPQETQMKVRAAILLLAFVAVGFEAPPRVWCVLAGSREHAKEKRSAPVDSGGHKIKAPHRVYTVQPDYPEKAKRRGIEGTVRLAAVIGKDGKVKELKPISGDRLLVKPALEAVKKWRYTPATLDGKVVEAHIEIDVNFALKQ
jgi:TonB family protein